MNCKLQACASGGVHLFPIDETHPQYNSNSCN